MELNEFERAVIRTVNILQGEGINPATSKDTERLFKSLSGRENETQEDTVTIDKDVQTGEDNINIPLSQGTVSVYPNPINWASVVQSSPKPVKPALKEGAPVPTPQIESLGINDDVQKTR